MDPFGDDHTELTGSLITLEFGPGGRITQMWATDPALPEEGEEFQFILPPLAFGEESAEDLFPGTILIGARTDPQAPWILSRNGHAQIVDALDDDRPDDGGVTFEYDFPLLPEIQATGRFYEVPGEVPQIVWDLTIRNRGRIALEIGELGFPLALNTFYDGFGWSDEQLSRLWTSRLYVHKFIGGAASWLFAQRMTSEPPGLLIFPGDDTGWEFFAHVASSLNTPHQWEGIPVVYVYSRAAVEREGWRSWSNEHTSLILEPGDQRTFQMRFVPTDRDKQDGVNQALAACGRPAIKLLPGAVAPVDVGIAVEVQGATPTRFFVSRDATIETDSDEDGGFCFVQPREQGPLRLSFEDTQGRLSHVHLMFTEPLETLIRKRARFIVDHQVVSHPGHSLDAAIVLTNCATMETVTDPSEYLGASGIECSLADALYLAEKNTLYPERREIGVLDDYIDKFLLQAVQNPGDLSVGSVLADGTGVGQYAGRPLTYPDVFSLYHAMFRIARSYGATRRTAADYLVLATGTVESMFRYGWRHYVLTVGILGYARVYDLLRDLDREGLTDMASRIRGQVEAKARTMVKQRYPYAGESVMDTSGFEEVFHAALFLNDDEHLERTMRCAYAARSLAPSWWWYGSDKRSWDGADSTPMKALADRGEACLAHTTIPNSAMFFAQLDRDYLAIPEAYMRLAFGGMLGPWALVRSDGAASMCFCPDLSSKHFGYNAYTGASGLGYTHYLQSTGSYVLPNRSQGLFTFGCHFDQDDRRYRVRPWDGVGRRVVLRQIGARVAVEFGRIEEVDLDLRKRWVEVSVVNPADQRLTTSLILEGLWGRRVKCGATVAEAVDGEFHLPIELPANSSVRFRVEVVS